MSACGEAGVDNLTFQDLRRPWTSRAAEMGAPEHVRGATSASLGALAPRTKTGFRTARLSSFTLAFCLPASPLPNPYQTLTQTS